MFTQPLDLQQGFGAAEGQFVVGQAMQQFKAFDDFARSTLDQLITVAGETAVLQIGTEELLDVLAEFRLRRSRQVQLRGQSPYLLAGALIRRS